MKSSEIKVGKTYSNKGAGRTQRTVLKISTDLEAPWFSCHARPANEPVVKFEQSGRIGTLYLKSFASWAGKAVS